MFPPRFRFYRKRCMTQFGSMWKFFNTN